MKNVSKAILACIVLFATFMYSCDKEITTSPLTVDKTQKGTIKGYVYANTDLTALGYETAPQGTKVIITLSYSEIIGLENSTATLNDTVELASDGTFEYKVPTDADGVNIHTSIEFTYDQKQPLGSQSTTRLKVFKGDMDFFVKANGTDIKRITCTEADVLDEVNNKVTISGTMYCDYDLSTTGAEKLSGTQLIFHTLPTDSEASWSTTITVNADGTYSASVPAGKSIYFDYNFTLSGKKADKTIVTFRFQTTNQLIGSYSVNTKNIDETTVDGVIE